MPYEPGSPHPEATGDPHAQYATDTEFVAHATRHQAGGADPVTAGLHAEHHIVLVALGTGQAI